MKRSTIQVLIVDDFAASRLWVRSKLGGKEHFQIVGEAVDGLDTFVNVSAAARRFSGNWRPFKQLTIVEIGCINAAKLTNRFVVKKDLRFLFEFFLSFGLLYGEGEISDSLSNRSDLHSRHQHRRNLRAGSRSALSLIG